MRGRRTDVTGIREILRCYQVTGAIKEVARTLGCAKGTVRRYVRWAKARGYLAGGNLPTEAELAREWVEDDKGRAIVQSSLEVHREAIQGWLDAGIIVTRIHEMLTEEHGWTGSYESLKRFTRPMREDIRCCVRLEVSPGSEAQVDFGHAGVMWDPVEKRRRRAWLFLMTLSHSRHAYGEFVFTQDTRTWISCHAHAFEYFGGVPKKIVLDNLKAAIIRAAVHDPMVNRTYRECAEHYGFLISPCLPGMPEHKGKVERGVPYVRKSFIAGREFRDKADANARLIDWLINKAGYRIHGTTKQQPLKIFDMVEKGALLPLPEEAFEISTWKEATLHRDCHVTVEGSYYSAPHTLRGQKLMICLVDNVTRIFHNYHLIAVHIRAHRPGTRRTLKEHYPPEKAAYLEHTPQWCLKRAKEIGNSTHALVDAIFHRQHPLDGLRMVQGVIHLAGRYQKVRVEAACHRAIHFGNITYRAVKNILEKELDRQPIEEEQNFTPASRDYAFARPINEFLKQEVIQWN